MSRQKKVKDTYLGVGNIFPYVFHVTRRTNTQESWKLFVVFMFRLKRGPEKWQEGGGGENVQEEGTTVSAKPRPFICVMRSWLRRENAVNLQFCYASALLVMIRLVIQAWRTRQSVCPGLF